MTPAKKRPRQLQVVANTDDLQNRAVIGVTRTDFEMLHCTLRVTDHHPNILRVTDSGHAERILKLCGTLKPFFTDSVKICTRVSFLELFT